MSGFGVDSNKTYADDQVANADILNTSGVHGSLTVGTSSVEIKVSGSRLSDRKCVTLLNNSTKLMYWGYSNSVTAATGTPVEKGQLFTWAIGQDLAIWVIGEQAGQDARVTESA